MESTFEKILQAVLGLAAVSHVLTDILSFFHHRQLQLKHPFRAGLLLYDPPPRVQALSWASRILFCVASVIEISWAKSFHDPCTDVPAFLGDEEAMNPDIGGGGVRYATHITAGVTILCTMINHYGVKRFGVKELGIAQLTSGLLRDI